MEEVLHAVFKYLPNWYSRLPPFASLSPHSFSNTRQFAYVHYQWFLDAIAKHPSACNVPETLDVILQDIVQRNLEKLVAQLSNHADGIFKQPEAKAVQFTCYVLKSVQHFIEMTYHVVETLCQKLAHHDSLQETYQCWLKLTDAAYAEFVMTKPVAMPELLLSVQAEVTLEELWSELDALHSLILAKGKKGVVCDSLAS